MCERLLIVNVLKTFRVASVRRIYPSSLLVQNVAQENTKFQYKLDHLLTNYFSTKTKCFESRLAMSSQIQYRKICDIMKCSSNKNKPSPIFFQVDCNSLLTSTE